MTIREVRRNPKFDPIVSVNDCTEEDEEHKWENISIEVDACVYCPRIRTKEVHAP